MIGPFFSFFISILGKVPRSGDHNTIVFLDDEEGHLEVKQNTGLRRVGWNEGIIWNGIFCTVLWLGFRLSQYLGFCGEWLLTNHGAEVILRRQIDWNDWMFCMWVGLA